MARTGTHTLDDLLVVQDQSVIAYGEDTVAATVAAELAAFSAQVEQVISEIAEVTTDRQRKYGNAPSGDMADLDEFGVPVAQKTRGGSPVGFPLRKVGAAIGWTKEFLLRATPADIALATIAQEKAYMGWVLKEIRTALMRSTNYTFADLWGANPGIDLAVKALANADGAPIPRGPHNEEFDGASHSHLSANAGLTNAVAIALVENVVEHGSAETVRIYINVAQEGDWRGLADFNAAQSIGLKIGDGQLESFRLDESVTNDRRIGTFRGAEVWVKPWIPANYALCLNLSAPDKPVVWRNHDVAALRGLRLAAKLESHPLRADVNEAYGGAGVYGRTSAAVLYTGGAAYVDPTF